MQEGPGPPECMVSQEEVPRELAKETQIQPEEELKEINLGAKLRSQKPIRGRMRGHLRPKRPPEEKEIEKGAQHLRTLGMCNTTGTWRKVDLSLMKVHGA